MIVNLVLNPSPNLPISSQISDFKLGIFIRIMKKLKLLNSPDLKFFGCCAVFNMPSHKLDIVSDIVIVGHGARPVVVWPTAIDNLLEGDLVAYFCNARKYIFSFLSLV